MGVPEMVLYCDILVSYSIDLDLQNLWFQRRRNAAVIKSDCTSQKASENKAKLAREWKSINCWELF